MGEGRVFDELQKQWELGVGKGLKQLGEYGEMKDVMWGGLGRIGWSWAEVGLCELGGEKGAGVFDWTVWGKRGNCAGGGSSLP